MQLVGSGGLLVQSQIVNNAGCALFDCVQDIPDGRFLTKPKVNKHEFAFPGLVNCGHCGCALVAEKKGKYIYYQLHPNKGTSCCRKLMIPTLGRLSSAVR